MAKQGKAKVLTDDEFKRLLRVAQSGQHANRNITILYFSFGLGLRAKELALLNLGDVFDCVQQKIYDQAFMNSLQVKGESARFLYLTNSKLRKALATYIEETKPKHDFPYHPERPLFLSQKAGRFSPNSIQQLLYHLYQLAGIKGASSHSGRRTFATRLIEKGVDIKAVSTLMGHRSITMTAKYVEDNPVRLGKISEDIF